MMTTEFIGEHAQNRMNAMGHDDYELLLRTVRVNAGQRFTIPAWRFWIYVPTDLASNKELFVESNFGRFHPGGNHNRQQYEHTGAVEVFNPTTTGKWLSFYAALPR